MYIITTSSAVNPWSVCILGIGWSREEALLDAYGRPKLEKGHHVQKINPDDEDWADCPRLDQYR